MSWIDADRAAVDLMVPERSVKSLPEVAVLHRRHLAEAFPTPAVFTPLRQAVGQPLLHVVAGRNERHTRGLIERFEPANNGQQLQALAADARLRIARFQRPRAIATAEYKPPAIPGTLPVWFGQ